MFLYVSRATSATTRCLPVMLCLAETTLVQRLCVVDIALKLYMGKEETVLWTYASMLLWVAKPGSTFSHLLAYSLCAAALSQGRRFLCLCL